eukprot:2367574-Pyramimonas_sp.AAC.1
MQGLALSERWKVDGDNPELVVALEHGGGNGASRDDFFLVEEGDAAREQHADPPGEAPRRPTVAPGRDEGAGGEHGSPDLGLVLGPE